MGKAAVERQVIVTWYKPKEKLPPDYASVVATISGRSGNIVWENAMMIMEYSRDGCGWIAADDDLTFDELTVHAWCDLEAYGL